MSTAVLVLEDGTTFRGESFGAEGATLGEAVFCTGMTGYQETLTDPSYHRQIVVATAPQIGNTGWNNEDSESRPRDDTGMQSRPRDDTDPASGRIWVAGYAVRDPARRPSSWRATGSLDEALVEQGVVGIAEIDTRAAVRHLRERGAMRAGIFSGDALADTHTLLQTVLDQPSMLGADLAAQVSTRTAYVVEPLGEPRFTVAALDLGIKSNTPRMLAQRGVRVHVLPSSATLDDVLATGPDGFFLSNGPGDPAATDEVVELTKQVLERRLPLFGICFGNQLFARALGRGTYKMRYGHRGMNIPVIEHATGRVAITAQNHGFAVEGEAGEEFDTPYGRAAISHTCPNDGTVEGVALLDGSAFSVQYHPEAAAGPHDAAGLFDRFTDQMKSSKDGHR